MLIDAYTHILPSSYMSRLLARSTGRARDRAQTLAGIDAMVDLEARFRLMDHIPDYRQVLTLSGPPAVTPGAPAHDLARLANDEMAELVARYPGRFAGFAAALPMGDPDAAVDELERCMATLGALGAQIHTNVDGVPLDDARFRSIFATAERTSAVLWVHGIRSRDWPDYPTEESSKYGIWLAFGWPYEISVFMTRMIFSGTLDRHPRLRFIVHHGGGMIPAFGQRVRPDGIQGTVDGPDGTVLDGATPLHASPAEYFRTFFADTSVSGVRHAIESEVAFFGAERVVFGTDMPFGRAGGLGVVQDTLAVIAGLRVTAAARRRILGGTLAGIASLQTP